eukprot:SAG31_NODE_1234_length_9204_cov_9.297748_6_plen_244_part_00
MSARRAETANAQQQRESSASAATVQREHQQTLIQIARTERWIDECVNPVLQCLSVYRRSRYRFVGVAAAELQREQPETFALLYSESHSLTSYRQDAGGSLWHINLNIRIFDPNWPSSSTQTADNNVIALTHCMYATAAEACDVGLCDLINLENKPYCDWLPTIISEMLGSDPNSNLAHEYRAHIRCEVLARLRQISDILTAQGAVVQLPSNDWLYTKCALHPSNHHPSSPQCHDPLATTAIYR